MELAPLETILESFKYLTGFIITLLTLTVMWWVTALVGRYFIAVRKRELALQAAKTPASTEAAVEEEGELAPEVICIIAASVHAILDTGHRIVSITPSSTNWSQEGRRQIFDSHRMR